MGKFYMNNKEILKKWFEVEKFFVTSRYAVRDIKTGKPQEACYDDVARRIGYAWLNEPYNKNFEPEVKFIRKNYGPAVVNAVRNRKVIPNTPALATLGTPSRNKCYHACFPLGKVEDSMEGIMETATKMARIYKCGGGVGIDISSLRPKGSLIDNGQGTASGPVSFMELFGAVTGVVSQGGRRRGALMVQMDSNHPDIDLFITAKDNVPMNHPLSNMNISVNIWNFERAKEKGILRKLAEHAWKSGDPGVFFMENQQKMTPIPLEHEPYYSNPCAEYLSIANTSCNLVTINLRKIAEEAVREARKHGEIGSNEFTKAFLSEYYRMVFENAKLACMWGSAIVAYDAGYPLDEIRKNTQKFRPTGVGFTGLAEVLMILNHPYGSDSAAEFARKTQAVLLAGTLAASYEIAKVRDNVVTARVDRLVPDTLVELFEEMTRNGEIEHYYLDVVKEVRNYAVEKGGLFNIVTTSQMPTGSTSIFGMVSATGIEPFWDFPTVRMIRDGDNWKEVELYPVIPEGYDMEEIEKYVKENCAHNVSFEGQLKMVAAVQEFCHTSVSKTINLPNSATIEEIEQIFNKAYEMGLKAVSVYRDGCKEFQVLRKKEEKKEEEKKVTMERNPIRFASTYEFKGPQTLFVKVTHDDEGYPHEIFLRIGKSGNVLDGLAQALGIACSIGIQYDPALARKYAKSLRNIDTGERYWSPIFNGPARSIPDAIAMVLGREWNIAAGNEKRTPDEIAQCLAMCGCGDIEEVKQLIEKLKKESNNQSSNDSGNNVDTEFTGDICPQCGEMALVRQGGCKCCKKCGYSTC